MAKLFEENIIITYELTPYTRRKSFYGKAHVIETENYYYLKSYDTYMCRVLKGTKNVERLSSAKSNTTSCHLSAFYSEFNLGDYTGKKFYSLDRIDPVNHEEEKAQAEAWYNNFKKDYDDLHPEIKKRLADSDVILTSQEQADDLMRVSKMFSLMMKLTEK